MNPESPVETQSIEVSLGFLLDEASAEGKPDEKREKGSGGAGI
jgi:hypothetical protein